MRDATPGAGQIGVVTSQKTGLEEKKNPARAVKVIESVSAQWSLQKRASAVGDGTEACEGAAFWR